MVSKVNSSANEHPRPSHVETLEMTSFPTTCTNATDPHNVEDATKE